MSAMGPGTDIRPVVPYFRRLLKTALAAMHSATVAGRRNATGGPDAARGPMGTVYVRTTSSIWV
jgi:hypothetical protein